MNNTKYHQIIFANMAESMEQITKDIFLDKKTGIIITLVSKYKPAFGFIAVGENKKDSMKLYDRMFNKLM